MMGDAAQSGASGRGSPAVVGDDGGEGSSNGRPGRPRSTGKVTGTMRMMKTLSMAGTLFSRNSVSFLSQIETKAGPASPGEFAPLTAPVHLANIYGPRKLPSGNTIFDPIDCMQRFRMQFRASQQPETPLSPVPNEVMIVGTVRKSMPLAVSPSEAAAPAPSNVSTVLKAPAIPMREITFKPRRHGLDDLTTAIFSSSPKTLQSLAFVQLPELLELVFDPANESPVGYPEVDVVEVVVLNHSMFTTTDAIVEEAMARFRTVAPPEATNKEKLEYKQHVDPIRRRAVHVLSRLITRCWLEVERRRLVPVIEEFADSLQTGYKQMYIAHAYQLQEAIRSQRMTSVSSSIRMFMRTPITPDGAIDTDPHLMADRANAIAEEITLMEQQEFRLIRVHQWLPLVHPDGVAPTDETVRLALMPISWFVRMSRWVATEVVEADSNQMRAYTIRKFIKIAIACRELRNYNSVAWIVHGLAHPAVARLTSVWQAVPKKFTESFEELEKLVQPRSNFAQYRAELEAAKPPLIPVIGVLMQDLTAVEKMTSTEESMDGTTVVRFDRCLALYNTVSKVETLQLTSYKIKSDEALRTYVAGSTALDDESLMQVSRQITDSK